MKFLVILFVLFHMSGQFELGRLYHYSYESQVQLSSFGLTGFRPVQLTGHVDVCAIWSDGDSELLRVEFHAHHRHSASGVQSDFAILHINGNQIVSTMLPASFSNSTISSILSGFTQLLVKKQDEFGMNDNFLVKNEFDNSFGQHHPISIDAKQLTTLPLFDDQKIEPVSIVTTLQAHLLSTSECSHVSVEGKDVKTALEVVSSKTGAKFVKVAQKLDLPPIKADSKFTCRLNDALAQVDCVTSSTSPELHASIMSGMFTKPTLVRRYFSNMCTRRHDERRADFLASIIRDSLGLSVGSNPQIDQEVSFGISCLLNHVCVKGQSKICQMTSSLVFEHLQSSYKKCKNHACQIATVRAFDGAMTNFPIAEPFIFKLATAKDQHPQIAAGCLRSLGRPYHRWVPTDTEFRQLLDFFENSPILEIRFATLDLFLSSSSFLLENHNYAKEFAQAVERIVEIDSEFSGYLSTRLRFLIANDGLFRKKILSNYGRLVFSLKSSLKNEVPLTSIYVQSEIFNNYPVSYMLDVQNSAQDTILHSSFSIKNGDWKLFEFEIDTVGVDSVIGGGGEAAKKETTEPGASISLKLSGAPNRGAVIARHVELFRGKDDMMSAVWSAPSDLTEMAKVNVTFFDPVTDRVQLINGLVVETALHVDATVHVQGSVSISLWTQSAETLVSTRVGVSARNSLLIPVLGLSRSYEIAGSADIAFRTNLGLGSSGKPDVCLRMSREKVQLSTSVTSSKSKKVVKSSLLKVAPVNYAFHIYNSQACKTQLQNSGDSDDDNSW